MSVMINERVSQVYDAWCEDCCGYLYTVRGGVLRDVWESKGEAEKAMSCHHNTDPDHYVIVARAE